MKLSKTAGFAICVTAALAIGGGAFWWRSHEQVQRDAVVRRLTYNPEGSGSFAEKKVSKALTVAVSPATNAVPTSRISEVSASLTTAREAYAKGRYKDAEQAAKQVVVTAPRQGRATIAVASARHLLAFAAARRGDLNTARTRFAQARQEAEHLPAPSPTLPALGDAPEPTLVEDSAYQHAVCTMALGDKTGAEREFVQFMRDFPDSPLVHGSMRRIARMHGGNIPKDVETVWKHAMDVARVKERQEQRDASLCAPECLAELLKRRGTRASVETLAREMKTSEEGSTVEALQTALRQHGFSGAQGVRLTMQGLRLQALPVVALVSPGHFVLIDAVAADGAVTIWDGGSPGRPVARPVRTLPAAEWSQNWQGIAVSTAAVTKKEATPSVRRVATIENRTTR